MTFQEAFEKAFEIQEKRYAEKGVKFNVSSRTANTLAFLWNMLAVSDFVLDDFAFIVDNNGVFDIVSIPKEAQDEEGRGNGTRKGKKGKKGKGQKPSTVADEPTGGDDGAEK